MPRLVGFVHSVELELQFTGQELFYLAHAAQRHYDWECQATAHIAGRDGRDRNGILTILTRYLDRVNHSWDDWRGELLDYLAQHPDKTVQRSLSWDNVDLLTKVAEGFETSRQTGKLLQETTGLSPVNPYDPEIADRIYKNLRGSLRAASQHLSDLYTQEKTRRLTVQS